MGFESNTGLGVNNHYGTRNVGGEQGELQSAGAEKEITVNFDGDALGFKVEIPAGAVISDLITDFATGAVSAATVGAVDISTASPATFIAVPLGGSLTVTGPTAGTVVVKYLAVA